MKSSALVALFASALTVTAHPLSNLLPIPRIFGGKTASHTKENIALEARDSKPTYSHGRCKFALELTEAWPERDPAKIDYKMLNMTDGKGTIMTKPIWSNGESIYNLQHALNGTAFLNDIIEPGSELRLEFGFMASKSSPSLLHV